MEKASISSIIPLGESQLAFLVHHLSTKEDKGLVQLCFDIEGALQIPALQNALNTVAEQYEVLRATIHWEKIKKPVAVIHRSATVTIEMVSAENISVFDEDIFRNQEKKKGITFHEKGITRMVLFQRNEKSHFCVWTFHHILVDGWSATNLLNALFSAYQAITSGLNWSGKNVPTLENIRKTIASLSYTEAADYWMKLLAGFERLNGLNSGQYKQFNRVVSILTSTESEQLASLSRKYKKSQATLLQLAWSLTLSKIYRQSDVVYGVVSSGRNIKINGIENAAYLLSNTVPFRFTLSTNSIEEGLSSIEKQKSASYAREHDHLSDIEKWIDWQGKTPLVESIFAYANFEWNDLNVNNISVKNLKGDYTSTHAISLILFEDTTLRLIIDFGENLITQEEANLILHFFKTTLLSMATQELWANHLNSSKLDIEIKKTLETNNALSDPNTYAYPTTPGEQLLNRVWQQVLGINAIGIDDDFFALGGTSVQALRICMAIEKETGSYLNPTAILLNPTIRKLAATIEGDNDNAIRPENSCVVPLKTTGNLPPLFCLHAGEGHILFYRDLANNMPKEIPLYAVQPKPINDAGDLPSTIVGMAKQYYNEITSIAKGQPLYILATCFSCPISLEMGELAIADNVQIGGIFIADSHPIGYISKDAKRKGIDRFAWRVMRIVRHKEYLAAIKRVIRRQIKKQQRKKLPPAEPSLRDQLAKNLIGYQYGQHDFSIEFLRSSEMHIPRYEHHYTQWKEIVAEVNMTVIQNSTHKTFFTKSSSTVAKVISNKIKQQSNEA